MVCFVGLGKKLIAIACVCMECRQFLHGWCNLFLLGLSNGCVFFVIDLLFLNTPGQVSGFVSDVKIVERSFIVMFIRHPQEMNPRNPTINTFNLNQVMIAVLTHDGKFISHFQLLHLSSRQKSIETFRQFISIWPG